MTKYFTTKSYYNNSNYDSMNLCALDNNIFNTPLLFNNRGDLLQFCSNLECHKFDIDFNQFVCP